MKIYKYWLRPKYKIRDKNDFTLKGIWSRVFGDPDRGVTKAASWMEISEETRVMWSDHTRCYFFAGPPLTALGLKELILEMHPLRQLPKFFNSSCQIRNREKSCLNLPGKPSQWQTWFLLPLGCFCFWGTKIFETAVTLVKWSLWGNCAHYRSHKCHWTLLKVNTHQKTKTNVLSSK